jgi:hypothetical protein
MTNKTRKTREITIETHSVTIIRASSSSPSAHCDHCLKAVSAFAPDQIAKLLQVSLAEIYRRVEIKQIHLTNNGEGVALICGNSIQL